MNPSRALKLIPLLLGFVSCALVGKSNQQITPDLSGITRLEIKVSSGNVTVSRAANADLLFKKDGRVETTAVRDGTTFKVTVKGLEPECYPCSADIEMKIPQALEIMVNSGNADIVVNNAATTATLESGNGKISVDGVNDLNAKTSNGEIYVTNLKGRAVLSSNNGKITLEKAAFSVASQNSIRTSNGDIRLNSVSAEGGFVISGNTSTPTFQLSGFDLKTGINTFTATRAGQTPTTLSLETGNGTIQVNP
jgi:DUF4097 and DUF4098 domain-containing protein YvlB